MIVTNWACLDEIRKINDFLWELSLCLSAQYKRMPNAYHWRLFDIADELAGVKR